MKPRSCKDKGRRAAVRIKKLLHETFPEIPGADVTVALSGQNGEDLIFSESVRNLLPISIESKNRETLNIWEALSQCEGNAGDYAPVLFFTRNRAKLYVAVDALFFLELLKVWATIRKKIGGLKNG